MSEQPHKQRTAQREAPLHERHDQVRAHLSEDLRAEFDQRSVRVNAGDTVRISRGDFAGEEAEVVEVDLRDAVVYVEDITTETADGEEVPRPLDASNLLVTDVDLDDERRAQRLEEDDT
ncbi:MAG: 50S ribosomal protein L24 [Halobacteriaceae archaeon]